MAPDWLQEIDRELRGHVLAPERLTTKQRAIFDESCRATEEKYRDYHAAPFLYAVFLATRKPSSYPDRSQARYHIAVHHLLTIRRLMAAEVEREDDAIRARDVLPDDAFSEPRAGWIYFIEAGGFIKIGFTTNVPARLASIETSSPHSVTLLRQEPGTMRDEAAYHARFAAHRVRREWFALDGDLAAFLARTGEAS